jgi:hypothetical protein
MASRQLKNWLTSYMEYVKETESARVFHKWVGRSIISACLRKKVRLALGRINIYPNLYIVLVAEPGRARKTQAITFGQKILSEIPDVFTSADATTKEALIEVLESSSTPEQMPDGTTFTHSSMSIIAKEFETFLGQKKENTKMVVFLTDIFDAQEMPWKYRTKHSGDNVIPSVYVNLIGATTPESLASILPTSAIGGGLTSRILFIYAEKREKAVAYPEMTEEIRKLEKALAADLFHIGKMAGTFDFSPDAKAQWKEWYNKYEEDDPRRVCKDPAFAAWYSRKPTYILKVAQILSSAESNSLTMEWKYLDKAIQDITSTEPLMGRAFAAVGRSAITAEMDTVLSLIRHHKCIGEKALLSTVWRDIDSKKFDVIMDTCIKAGMVRRTYEGPRGEKGGVWYVWVG